MNSLSLNDLCYKIPKAELHIHIEGTFEPELIFSIAKRNNIPLPYTSVNELKSKYQFNNLQDFLDIYYQACNTLQTEEDFSDLAFAYVSRSCPQGLTYAEIFFDPQSHLPRGVSFKTLITGLKKGLDKGKEKFNFDYKLIMCFLRHLSEKDAINTLNEALPFKEYIVAVGLDSSELGNPPEKFEKVFAKAKEEGFKLVAHAGEEGPSSYIDSAIELLKVERIDHGVRIMENAEVIDKAVKRKIPLTLCPLSNKKLKVCPDLKKYMIREMMNKGLIVMVNSDDPSYFGGYIGDNYKVLVDELGLTKEEIIQLAKNSFNATFMTLEEKEKWINEIKQYE